jgi:hypothetical protein
LSIRGTFLVFLFVQNRGIRDIETNVPATRIKPRNPYPTLDMGYALWWDTISKNSLILDIVCVRMPLLNIQKMAENGHES